MMHEDSMPQRRSFWQWLKDGLTKIPLLGRECPFGGSHWWFERLCTCGFGSFGDQDDSNDWHGGVFDMRGKCELQPCGSCVTEHSTHNHQWSLSAEEECLLSSWRSYGNETLSYFRSKPYKYRVWVELNDLSKTLILTRFNDAAVLRENTDDDIWEPKNRKPN